jgi:hypothetical protein
VLDGVFDTGLSVVLDTYETASALAEAAHRPSRFGRARARPVVVRRHATAVGYQDGTGRGVRELRALGLARAWRAARTT